MPFLRDYRPQKNQCFVLMPYGEKSLDGQVIDWDEHYRMVLEPAIEQAGLTPRRADNIFGTQPLIDRVWRGIQEAEVIVAELTGRSPNVMYEIGLANVIGKRLILLTTSPSDVPVDLAHYVVVGYSHDGIGLVKLTRELQANLQAARSEPLQEAMLVPLIGGDVEAVPAVVEYVAESYVTVRATNNRMGFLHPEDASHVRSMKDMQRHFRLGQQLNGCFVVDVNGESRYSLIANQDNPWPKILSEFPEGTTFIGTVKNAPENVGAFVAIAHGVNGLIGRGQLPSGGLRPGDQVEASVLRIDQNQRQVDLRLERVVRKGEVSENWERYAVGDCHTGTVKRISQERGYVLIALPPGRTGLLNIHRMDGVRAEFEAGRLQLGQSLQVEIVEVDAARERIILRDRS